MKGPAFFFHYYFFLMPAPPPSRNGATPRPVRTPRRSPRPYPPTPPRDLYTGPTKVFRDMRLTKGQAHALLLRSKGVSYAQVGAAMGVTPERVRQHMWAVARKWSMRADQGGPLPTHYAFRALTVGREVRKWRFVDKDQRLRILPLSYAGVLVPKDGKR